jgi:hypothetical protein
MCVYVLVNIVCVDFYVFHPRFFYFIFPVCLYMMKGGKGKEEEEKDNPPAWAEKVE